MVNLFFIHQAGYKASNYGFVCSSDYSPFAVLGRWPVYVASVIAVLGLVFIALTWPFCGRRTVMLECIRPFRG